MRSMAEDLYPLVTFDGKSGPPFFVFTSNVDNGFLKAGFPDSNLIECHGTISFLQCVAHCTPDVWPTPHDLDVDVDEDTFRAEGEMPTCIHCDGLARPNVMMFGDWTFSHTRLDRQEAAYDAFTTTLKRWAKYEGDDCVAIVEIGAGKTVPTVRRTSERLAATLGSSATLIRINPADQDIPDISPARPVSLPMGGLAALSAIRDVIAELRADDDDDDDE